MLSCLLDSWVSLGCFRARVAPRLPVLALQNVAVSPSQHPLCASSPLWWSHGAGLQLLPLHCCYLSLILGSFWRPSPLHLNTVAGDCLACCRLSGSTLSCVFGWGGITRPTWLLSQICCARSGMVLVHVMPGRLSPIYSRTLESRLKRRELLPCGCGKVVLLCAKHSIPTPVLAAVGGSAHHHCVPALGLGPIQLSLGS